MTVRLFQRTRFRGESAVIGRDVRDLARLRIGRNPLSMTMDEHDAVLLFGRDDWSGDVRFYRGRNHVRRLRSRRPSARVGLVDPIASVRITPFFIGLNTTVVTDPHGTLPGGFAGSDDIEAHLRAMLTELNAWYDRERVLLRAHLTRIVRRHHRSAFDLSATGTAVDLPATWRADREIDLLLVNSIEHAPTTARARHPLGTVAVAAMRRGGPRGSPIHPACLAMSVAREVGHVLGSTHHSARRRSANIMVEGVAPIAGRSASVEQIRRWHRALSRSPARRRNHLDS